MVFEDIQDDEVLANHGEATFLIWPAENSNRVVEMQVGIRKHHKSLMLSHGASPVLLCLKPLAINYHFSAAKNLTLLV